MQENRCSLSLSDPKLISAVGHCKPGETKKLTIELSVTRSNHSLERDYEMSPAAVGALGKKKKMNPNLELVGTVKNIGYEEKEPAKAKAKGKMSSMAKAAMDY